jgi:uncharacterized membrane protein
MMEPVRCIRCDTSNQPDYTYCVKCGAPLPSASGSPLSAEEEIQRLRRMVGYISAQLNILEKTPPAPAIPLKESITAITPDKITTTFEDKKQVEIPAPLPSPSGKPKPKKEREWEQILGGNWLARIGVLALIFGIGFFLKYAFDSNWIGPEARVILGSIAGFIMLGLGFWWRKRYPVLTQVLTGGGIAVFFLAIVAASAVYHLIGIYTATSLLLATSIISILSALYYNSVALSVIGIFGAYFAPFILGAFNQTAQDSNDTTQLTLLLVYIIMVSLGVIVLSSFRKWRWFTLLAVICSLITYIVWRIEFSSILTPASAEIGITIIFLIFLLTTVFFHIVQHRQPRAYDFVFLGINTTAYFIISTINLWDKYDGWMGGFTLLLAIVYGLLCFFTARRSQENFMFSRFMLLYALVFLTTAIPFQFRGGIWTPMFFAVEMVAGVWLSYAVKIRLVRYFSYMVFFVMVWDLLIGYTWFSSNEFIPVINKRFLVYIIGIVATYTAYFGLRRQRDKTSEWTIIAPLCLIITNLLTLWLISVEVWDGFGSAINSASRAERDSLMDARNLALTSSWAFCAIISLVIGIIRHWRWVRIGALGLLAVTIIKVFTFDVFQLETTYRIIAFVGLGVLLLLSAYLYQRFRKVIKGVLTD